MEIPPEEKLRKMPYSELKKHAIKRGIKKNLKSEALIFLLLDKAKKDAEDSFVTLENQIINSCKKNKQIKFEQDKKLGSDTPRRETYTLENPTGDAMNKQIKFEQDKELASDTPRRETYTLERPTGDAMGINNDLIVSSASPVLRKTPPTNETSFNVTMSRGSDRKMKKRKVSFVTPLRKSARLNSMTPHYASVKDRPKTPIPSRISSGRKMSPSVKAKISFAETPSEMELESSVSKRRSGRRGKRVSTPMPSSKCKRMNLSSSAGLNAPIATPEVSFSEPQEKIPEENIKSDGKKPTMPVFKFSATPENKRTPIPKLDVKEAITPSNVNRAKILTPKSNTKKSASPHSVNPKSIRTLTPRSNIKRVATPLSSNPKNIRILTPRSQVKKNATPLSASAKDKRTPRSCVKSASTSGVLSVSKVKVPNFKDLHQKAFDKMESIDEYQQRRAFNSAKKLKEHLHYQNLAKSSASKKVVSKNKGVNKFGGIPFFPSVTSIKDMKLDASSFGARCMASKKNTTASHNQNATGKKIETRAAKEPVKILTRENTPLKKRFKFDLQASLTKKLPYKPHKGPVKPLAEKNLNNTSIVIPAPTKSTTGNKFVEAKRVESRKVLRGVRVNRRFELQMQKRKLTAN